MARTTDVSLKVAIDKTGIIYCGADVETITDPDYNFVVRPFIAVGDNEVWSGNHLDSSAEEWITYDLDELQEEAIRYAEEALASAMRKLLYGEPS